MSRREVEPSLTSHSQSERKHVAVVEISFPMNPVNYSRKTVKSETDNAKRYTGSVAGDVALLSRRLE